MEFLKELGLEEGLIEKLQKRYENSILDLFILEKANVEDNIRYMNDYLKKNIPVLKMAKTESLYLTWVDCRGLGLDDEALNDFMLNKAHLYLDEGTLFGEEGSGFMRFNLACPRATLEN